ncbi:3-oxo-5-alpha-steroid 4-dehydrogenase 2 [Erethizon dorsatum]
MPVRCQESPVLAGSATLVAMGAMLLLHSREPKPYGKHSERSSPEAKCLPARAAWFLQELPSFAVPAGILVQQPGFLFGTPETVLLGLFCAHYFHRTFIYSLLTRGRPYPALLVFRGIVFCTGNGLLQSYYLIYCAEYPEEWYTDVRFTLGLFLFILGTGINIHSDYILRQLRKPGEVTYRIPQGGLFTYVSGANFLGEIIEWIGYALATWSVPALAFTFFSLCFLGLRAVHHHRFYLKTFEDYPKSRKALIPFIF